MAEKSPAEKVKGPASYFPSIEKNYGKKIEDWMKILKKAKIDKHMEMVEFHASALQKQELLPRFGGGGGSIRMCDNSSTGL